MSEKTDIGEKGDPFEFMKARPPELLAADGSVARTLNADIGQFKQAMKKQAEVLKLLGFAALRPGQDLAIYRLYTGADTICFLPTSGGKSAIYIIPTLVLGYRTLIISPLVALMQDQVQQLWEKHLPAAQISSGQTDAENRMAAANWESGDVKMLFCSPERLDMPEFRKMIIQRARPDMVAIDEAHVASSWADGFRPAYARVGKFIAEAKPKVVLALTATATPQVEEDIRFIYGLREAAKVVYYPQRKNLKFSSRPFTSDRDLFETIQEIDGPVIVYGQTQKRCENMYNMWGSRVTGGGLLYHGGMSGSERTTCQEQFMKDQVRVMFATNAFGMGVNKANIRGVVHRDLPPSIENLTQEAGRAGRDGLDSHCVALSDPQSDWISRMFIRMQYPDQAVVERTFHYLKKMSEAQGTIKLTIEDMAGNLRLDDRPENTKRLLGSCIGILSACGVVAREDGKAHEATRVKILKHEHLDDTAHAKVLGAIRRLGRVHEQDGWHEFSMEYVAGECDLKLAKFRTMLKELEASAYCQIAPAFRGRTTRVIGDMSLVDFDRLDARRKAAYDKLGDVADYVKTADSKKADFLQRYFGH